MRSWRLLAALAILAWPAQVTGDVAAAAHAGAPPLVIRLAPRDLQLAAPGTVYEQVTVEWADAAPAPAHLGSTAAEGHPSPAAYDGLRLHIHIPDGFRFVPGSMTLESDTLRVVSPGNPVMVDLPPLRRGRAFVLRYAIRARPDAAPGRHVTQAYVLRGERWMTPSVAGIIDLAGPAGPGEESFHGTVFHDHDGDGVRDAGDEGIAGVGLVLEDGTKSVSDEAGRFAFRVFSGTHLVTLDTATLPRGAEVVGDAQRLHDASELGIADLGFAVRSRAKFVEGLARHASFTGSAPGGSGAAGAGGMDGAKARREIPCEELTARRRESWGGYFVVEFPGEKERLARLRECTELAALEGAATPAPLASLAPDPAPGGGSPAVKAVPVRTGSSQAAPRPQSSGSKPATHTPAIAPANTRQPAGAPRVEPGPSFPAHPDSADSAAAAGAVTLEVGQKMFGLSTDRLTPGYEDMLHSLGALFEKEGLEVGLRAAPQERRDGPPNTWLERRRIAVVGEVIENGRKSARGSGSRGRAGAESKAPAPRSLVQSMTYAEDAGHARLLLTLSDDVPYASGLSRESALLLILHTSLAPDFRMPEIPDHAMLKRVSLDVSDQDGSVLLLCEPSGDLSFRARSFENPFRIELAFEPKLPAVTEAESPSPAPRATPAR